MFFVFNREKITSYLILLSTVVILFGVAMNLKKTNEVVTSTKPDDIKSNSIIQKNMIFNEYED